MGPRHASAALVIAALAACSSQPDTAASAAAAAATTPAPAATAAPVDRKYLLERVDDAAVVQLYADGFSALPLNEKRLV